MIHFELSCGEGEDGDPFVRFIRDHGVRFAEIIAELMVSRDSTLLKTTAEVGERIIKGQKRKYLVHFVGLTDLRYMCLGELMPEQILVTQAAYDALKIMNNELLKKGGKWVEFPDEVPRRKTLITELVTNKHVLSSRGDGYYKEYKFNYGFNSIKPSQNTMHWKMRARLEREAKEAEAAKRAAENNKPKRETIQTTAPEIQDAIDFHPAKLDEHTPKDHLKPKLAYPSGTLEKRFEKKPIVSGAPRETAPKPPWLGEPEKPIPRHTDYKEDDQMLLVGSPLPNDPAITKMAQEMVAAKMMQAKLDFKPIKLDTLLAFARTIDMNIQIVTDEKAADAAKRVKEIKLALVDAEGEREETLFAELAKVKEERDSGIRAAREEACKAAMAEERFAGVPWGLVIEF